MISYEHQKRKIIVKSVSELIPYIDNARQHSNDQINLIARSIKEFGFTNPVLIDGIGNVIAGHGRLMAARILKMDQVPCLVLDHLTEKQKRAYMLADNQIALRSNWNEELLKKELDALKIEEVDLSMLGFSEKELDALFPKIWIDEDKIPDVPEIPVSKIGDTWLLGDHRVRCGDSTNAVDVAALLDGAKPHLMVTDPPYGVEYDATWRDGMLDPETGKKKTIRAAGKVLNDDRSDWREAWALFPGNIAYVWHASLFGASVFHSLEDLGFKCRNQIIWNKNHLCIGRGDYHWQHEPCWYAVKGTGKWTGDRKQTTVWDIDKPQKSETGHSTQKPVECMRRPMMNNSIKGDSVYDPFLGSGTTVIAAETEERKCFGLELNPAYVDVIVKRWETFTGKKAILESTGRTFSEESSNVSIKGK